MDIAGIQQNVRELCHEVGAFIQQESENFDLSRVEQKDSFNNLVSYVDKEAERRLVATLHKLLPQAGFITEEETVQQSHQHEYNWIIDPLDGTTNFLHGLPIYAISIGLTRGETTILGDVYHVVRKECFHAIEGGPAYCNDKVIQVSQAPALSDSLLATGFPYYHSEKKDAYLDIIRDFLEKSHGIRRLGSAAIDLAYVACGRIEGFFEYNLNPWDVVAGAFIVQQAGGRVSDFSGGNNFVFGRELCAANGHIHNEMLSLIQRRWK
ncbi:inositol monophosphatase family protein [Parachryseolinea silvisoli]|uniref:inositol monophosphatase family protein n=1 Tax=Parachryseolinea silvisoli TaxID=2873601 RepID=UPI002265B6A8|nr:inositol monophosphatase family protein [Parachryseolinea silvisoli]MCD9016988.1 inositol monophosphatase [Parachryseolinea silvisoli]